MKKIISKLQNLSSTIRIKCYWQKKTTNQLFEGIKKTYPLPRFVEIMCKSKYRRQSELIKAR